MVALGSNAIVGSRGNSKPAESYPQKLMNFPHPTGPANLQEQTEVMVERLREGEGSVGLLSRLRTHDPHGAWVV
jgi:hypothetical protein